MINDARSGMSSAQLLEFEEAVNRLDVHDVQDVVLAPHCNYNTSTTSCRQHLRYEIERSKRNDCNNNLRHVKTYSTDEQPFHFHPNPTMYCFPPPPAYQSNPPSPTHNSERSQHVMLHGNTPINNASAPPLVVGENKNMIGSDNIITADHFQQIYGCRTTTTIVLIMIAVVLFAIFLTLLILLA